MEGFEIVEGVMEAIGNGAKEHWLPSKANHANVGFPFKASNFGQLMEIYSSSSNDHNHIYLACIICLNYFSRR